MISPKGESLFVCSFIVLAVKDFDFGIGADVCGAGFGLELNALAAQRGERARGLTDGDDGGGFADANDAAGLAFKLDYVTGLESENVCGHKLGDGR